MLKRSGVVLIGLWICLLESVFAATVPSNTVPSETAPSELHIVISGDRQAYHRFSDALRTQLGAQYAIATTVLDGGQPVQLPAAQMYIAVGTPATAFLFSQRLQQPVLSIFVTAGAWDSMVKKYYGDDGLSAGINAQAVVMDQPLQRYINLCSLLLPKLHSVGTAVGPTNTALLERYQHQSGAGSVALNFARLMPDANPLALIEPVMAGSDVFVALPDQSIYSNSTAKWALYLALRHRKPVVGFSEKYIDAGAVASLYSTPENIARQAREQIASILAGQWRKGVVLHPDYFTVRTNPRMAATLKITLADDLMQRLRAAEQDDNKNAL